MKQHEVKHGLDVIAQEMSDEELRLNLVFVREVAQAAYCLIGNLQARRGKKETDKEATP